jgi:hypothetical protein
MMDKGLARFCATLPRPPDEPLSDKAKKKRFDLIRDGVRDLAIDAAESIQAQNSIEFMLAHQVAAAHKIAMHFIASAQEDLSRPQIPAPQHRGGENGGNRRPLDGHLPARVVDAGPNKKRRNVIEGGQAVVAGTTNSAVTADDYCHELPAEIWQAGDRRH